MIPKGWPETPSPLHVRERVGRFARALRAAAQTAAVELRDRPRGNGNKIESRVTFTVQVEEDELDGGFVAECLDLPGCVSHGDTEREAIENLIEAIVGVLEARMQRHLKTELVEIEDHEAPRPHEPRELEIVA